MQFSAISAAVYGGLGVLAAIVGGWVPARAAQRLAPAQALKGLGDSAQHNGLAWLGPSMLVLSLLLALLPPIFDLPLAAYSLRESVKGPVVPVSMREKDRDAVKATLLPGTPAAVRATGS